ncbi:hypothetical protein FRC02_007707 [Tulasnella sp. 418]|nr:hypothetical protein FRC02_007707 [Tulasnella sp. 418]
MSTAFLQSRPTLPYSPISPSSGLPSPSFPPAVLSRTHSPSPAPISRRQSRQQSLRVAPLHHHDYVVDDVLLEGDIIGHGEQLHGELIETVHIQTSAHRSEPPPAHQLQVVRKLGAGSYATVYLVKEIVGRTLIPSPHNDEELSDSSDSVRYRYQYGREFAVKCLSKYGLSPEELDVQMSEATLHQSLPSHPNIVTLYRTLQTRSWLLLVLESVPGQDLFYFLEQSRDHHTHQHYNPATGTGNPDLDPLSVQPSPTNRSTASLSSLSQQLSGAVSASMTSQTPPTPSLLSTLHPNYLLSYQRLRLITSMFAQMCAAVDACHARGVSHRDIKPENFIVTEGVRPVKRGSGAGFERKVVVKLSDFGLATLQQESTDVDCGSAPYMSYECRNNVYPTYATQPADVWSLGIVLINMLYHHNPWSDTSIKPGHCLRDSPSASCYTCPSFAAFLSSPTEFFLQRFPGMTPVVADFLANRVFCILPAPGTCPSPRVTAREFGEWIKGLPRMMGQGPPSLPSNPPMRPSYVARPSKVDSIHIVHPDDEDDDEDDELGMDIYKVPEMVVLEDEVTQPMNSTMTITLPNVTSTSPRAALAAFSESEVSNSSPNTQTRAIHQGDGVDEASRTADENLSSGVGASTGDDDVQSTRSGKKRGKRGARKKNGQAGQSLPNEEEDAHAMASNVQTLARELSRHQYPRHGSSSRLSIGSVKSKTSHKSGKSTERMLAKLPPPPKEPPPLPPSITSPTTGTSSGLGRSLALAGITSAEGRISPAMMKASLSPPPSSPAPLPATTSPVTAVAETPAQPFAPLLTTTSPVTVPVNPSLTPKKSWRERLGLKDAPTSSSALGLSSDAPVPSPQSIVKPSPPISDIPQKSIGFNGTVSSLRDSGAMAIMANDLLVDSQPNTQKEAHRASPMVTNVSNLLTSLEARPMPVPSRSAKNDLSGNSLEDPNARAARNLATSPSSSFSAPSPYAKTSNSSKWGSSDHQSRSSRQPLSTSPPTNLNYAAPSFSTSSSSLDSPDWRSRQKAPSISGFSTITNSSASSSINSSRYSNGSIRSLSTAATSVSAGSGRHSNYDKGLYGIYDSENTLRPGSSAESGAPPRPRKPRTNIKRIDGVPNILDNLPRQHQRFGPGGMPTVKPNMPPPSAALRGKAAGPLDTISERTSAQSPPTSSPLSLRRPETASSSGEGEISNQATYPKSIASSSHFSSSSSSLGPGPYDQKKGAQRANALAKVLSGLMNKSGKD